jgi:hypothetical protein
MAFAGADTPGDGEDAFVIEFETDQEIRVKHRASGHVLRLDLTADGEAIADLTELTSTFRRISTRKRLSHRLGWQRSSV